MACGTITAISKGCDNNLGGLRKVYLIAFEDVLSVTETTGTVTAITLASGANYVEFSFNRDSASAADNATVNVQNHGTFYDQMVTLKLGRREVAKRNALAAIMQRELSVIVQDQNGLYWLFGKSNGMYVSELPSETGAAKGDFNGYTITLKGEEEFQAPEVDDAIIAGLL